MTHFILPKTGGELRRVQILGVLDAALDAVDPVQAIRRVMIRGEHTLRIDGRAYDLDHIRRIVVVGGGKAGAAMAAAVEELLADRITAGVVNVKYGHGAPTEIVQIRRVRPPGARRGRGSRGTGYARSAAGADGRGSGAVPHLGGRLGADDAAG